MGNYSSRSTSGRRTNSSRTSSYKGGRRSFHSGGNNRNSNKRRFGQTIDPKRFVKPASPIEIEEYVPTHKFTDFDLNEVIQQNLVRREYTVPSQIQDKSIPFALENKDVIGIANTGTGKTAAFLLPTINKLMANKGKKVLILAPTRELALQIQEESRLFSKGSRLYDVLLIGGTPMNRQLRDLSKNPEIIIGTPGRVKDHIERGTLKLESVNTVVLDEVDRMLDMGFINDIRDILSNLKGERQSLFFSATMSPTIENLIGTFTNSPTTVMARTAETSDNVDQSIMHYFEPTDKLDKLHDILLKQEVQRTLIFCETKRSTEFLSKELVNRGFTSDAMHGNKSQSQRQRALKKFKDGQVKILVATDVAARGIDVDDISHVINYDIPQTYDDYTHRIGRTGRAGTQGRAITFVTH
jgi:superfamily II DNA/RNA helicase